jgi:hypothetical protein
MRKALVMLAPFVLLAGSSAASEELSWRSYRSEAGRFTVELPAAPYRDEGGTDTWAGHIDEQAWEVDAAGVRLRVEHHDIPRIGRLLVPARRILSLAASSLMRDREGRLLEEREFEHSGGPALGVRYALEKEGDRPEEARLFLIGSRLFIAYARALDDGDRREAIDRFFASLELADQP